MTAFANRRPLRNRPRIPSHIAPRITMSSANRVAAGVMGYAISVMALRTAVAVQALPRGVVISSSLR